MDVGLKGVIIIWFGFLWPAAFVVIYKTMSNKRDAKINGFLALVISYVVYFTFSYIPIIPLWIMGVENFVEAVGETYGKYIMLSMFVVAMLGATALALFIFRKIEKKKAA